MNSSMKLQCKRNSGRHITLCLPWNLKRWTSLHEHNVRMICSKGSIFILLYTYNLCVIETNRHHIILKAHPFPFDTYIKIHTHTGGIFPNIFGVVLAMPSMQSFKLCKYILLLLICAWSPCLFWLFWTEIELL